MSQSTLVYYTDALCGWCYGLSPVMVKIADHFSDKLKIEVVSGGLFLGDRVGKVNAIAPYIKQGAYLQVEQTCGVKFGEAFLKDINGEERIHLNSLPLAIAICIVKEKQPNKALEFTESLLNAVYKDGMDSEDIAAYSPYALKVGINENDFLRYMKEPKYLQLAQQDFSLTREKGITGYPSLVLEHNGQSTFIASGFIDFDTLSDRINELLAR